MNSKKIYYLAIGFVLALNLFASETAIELPSEIVSGFKTGKAETVAKYFNNTVELTVNNRENIYSKTQAQLILKDFFKNNPPKDFRLLHEGGKGESKYAIGKLTTSNAQFRITLLVKSPNGKPHIHQLRIEKDEL